jgi:predicted dinucleotide-binding enzyme
MRVGMIGAGRIGANLARQWTKHNHDVVVSFKRDPEALDAVAEETGALAALPPRVSAAEVNARRFAGSALGKAFNTCTSGFQAAVGDGTHERAVAMFLGGEDTHAKEVASGSSAMPGSRPLILRGGAPSRSMEAPRRDGAADGEEYDPESGRRIATIAASDIAEASRLAIELKHDGR